MTSRPAESLPQELPERPPDSLPSGLTIRPYEPRDFARVREFVLDILVEELGLVYRRKDLERIEDEYRPPDSGFWVATVDHGKARKEEAGSCRKEEEAGTVGSHRTASGEAGPVRVVVGTVAVLHIPETQGALPGSGQHGSVGMVRRMYVARELRGRGLGRLLYSTAVEHCQRQGFVGLYLDTDGSMAQALEFYDRRGFSRLEGPLVDPGPNAEGCLIFMYKPLD